MNWYVAKSGLWGSYVRQSVDFRSLATATTSKTSLAKYKLAVRRKRRRLNGLQILRQRELRCLLIGIL